MPALLLLALTAAPPGQSALERVVADRFEAVGRTAPVFDVGLTRAAAQLAQYAQREGLDEAASVLRVTAAISRERGWDANTVVVGLRAGNAAVLDELKKQDLASEPSTHVGVGLGPGDERSAVIVLLARRRVELSPFPRAHKKPAGPQRLCATLQSEHLTGAELYVTRPRGTVEREPLAGTAPTLCGSTAFQEPGRHTVEVLATGARGPEVVALFFVDVGAVNADVSEAFVEPTTDKAARAELLVRINELRLQHGAMPLRADQALEDVAQAWAERLAREGFFSHVAPDGSSLKARLAEAGYRFTGAGENLGLSSGPLAAHFNIEHSPGHRNNLLDATHRRAGFGLTTRGDGLRILVELFASPVEEEKDPLRAVYESLDDERARRGLSALKRDPTLERLALRHAREAHRQNVPKVAVPGVRPLHEQVFDALPDVKSAAVDLFVADTPKVPSAAKNLSMTGVTMAGVGVVKSDTAAGKGRYWIVVVYGVPTAP